jgi:hypothetical protein
VVRTGVKRMGHEVAEKLVGAIERRDPDALIELFAEDAVLHHPLSSEPIEGKGGIAASEQALFVAFSDIEVEVLRVVAEAHDVLRLESHGKIAEERDYLDTASFLRQLGLASDT